MSNERRLSAAVAAICVAGVTACTAVTPTPPLTAEASASGAPRGAPLPSATPSAAPEGLAAEIEVGRLDPQTTHPILEFASDGRAIVFSSGVAPDSGAEAAPDLWRFEPGQAAGPELVWRNPERDHSIVKIAGDLGTMAFVDIPISGERAWNLWLVPEVGADPILLDRHPGDDDVPSLVPALSVYQPIVAWTAFDRGPDGPVSQLLYAEAPAWTPTVALERPAAEAELWLPSLYGRTVVFSEVRYSADHATDERSVHLLQLGVPDAEPRRLDTSGRATMPVIADDTVLWKEADPGFNMFNWGRMFQYDIVSGEVSPVSIWPQEYVNYPSAGGRFVAWWGADAFSFGVFDLVRDQARLIARYPDESETNVLRPHIAGDLLVWLYVEGSGPDASSELRYAYLPNAAADR